MGTLRATQDFRDAGTEKAFKRGDDVSSEDGAENYRAAGLASEDDADAAPASPDPDETHAA